MFNLFVGFERLVGPGGNPLDPHLLELQRRYGYPIPGGNALVPTGAHHIPGVYPPTSLASDLIARDRERLDRLGETMVFVSNVAIYKFIIVPDKWNESI